MPTTENLYSKAILAALAALVTLVMVLIANAAFAYDATLTWTHPTTNTDGTAIPASGAGSLTSTRVEYGTCSGTAFGTRAGEQIVPAPAATVTITGFAAGQVVCYRAFSRNTFGSESAASAVVSKTFPTPTPNPPVLAATITVAYELKGIRNDGTVLLGRAVGTLPLGAPCLDYPFETNKGTYYGIDRAHVTLTREPRSSMVVTQCGWTQS